MVEFGGFRMFVQGMYQFWDGMDGGNCWILTVVAISVPQFQFKALYRHNFISCGFTLLAKSTLKKQTS